MTGLEGERDDVGIRGAPTSSSSRPWRAPAALVSSVATATRDVDLVGVVATLPVAQQHALLHPDGGASACLLPLGPGIRVLDLAATYATRAVALASFGAEVTRADWCYDRLRFAQIVHLPRPVAAVHLATAVPLPFGSESFDVVCVDVADLPPETSIPALVAELRRVVAPGGTVSVTVSRSAPGAPAGSLGGGPRTARDARAVSAALRTGGFPVIRRFAELRAGGSSHQLVPLARSRQVLSRPLPARGRRGRLVNRAVATAARLGLGPVLVPSHVVLGSARAGGNAGLVQSLPELHEEPQPAVTTLSDARVALLGRDVVVKVPLSERERDVLAREVAKTRSARASALGEHVVPWAEVRESGAATYGVFPRIRHRPAQSLAEVDAALASALAAQPGAPAALGTTALWSRLAAERGRADVTELGADALAEQLHRLGPDRSVLVGLTHGDLHGGNVLLAAAGPAVLIDWNRSEQHNPLLLDAVYAAVRQHGRRTGGSLAAALVDYVEGRVTGQLADHATRAVGDLTRLDAATLVVLDRVASYSLPRGRYKPWTLQPLRQAVDMIAQRLTD